MNLFKTHKPLQTSEEEVEEEDEITLLEKQLQSDEEYEDSLFGNSDMLFEILEISEEEEEESKEQISEDQNERKELRNEE